MPRRRTRPSQTWRTFLENHLGSTVAIDFFAVPTLTCRILFVFVVLAHDRRRILHVNVTPHPTSAWTRQQLREAFPNDPNARFLLHDRDTIFDAAIRSGGRGLRSHGRPHGTSLALSIQVDELLGSRRTSGTSFDLLPTVFCASLHRARDEGNRRSNAVNRT